jgi:DNA polymerase-3 subunit gamma/tau
VYIVDEVHQLTNEAGTALLKTLEEPPDHVVFVLATTDPQKVSPPVRSRTQHFEFRLFGAEELGTLVHDVAKRAGIDLDERSMETVVRDGKGSARDALSVLEQVAAAGGARDEVPVAEGLVEALAGRDAGAVLVAVAEGLRAGRDPRRLGVELIERLRWCFLSLLAPDLVDCLDHERETIAEQAKRLGPAATTRAIEVIGEALVDQRESVDPRVTLEVALVRLTRPELDTSVSSLAERLERLERGAPPAAVAPPRPAVTTPAPAPPPGRPEPTTAAAPPAPPTAAAPAPAGTGPASVRATLGSLRGTARSAAAPAAAPVPVPEAHTPAPPVPSEASPHLPPPGPAPVGGGIPTRAELTKAWGDTVLPSLKPGPKSRYGTGRFISVDGDVAVFGVENEPMRKACDDRRAEVEAALAAYFGRPVPLRVVVDTAPGQPTDDAITTSRASADEDVDLSALTDAPAAAATDPTSLLLEAFPGTEELA